MKLKRNLSLNPDINNVFFSQLGLSDKSLGIQRLSSQSSCRLDSHDDKAIESVEVLSLDDLIRNNKIERVYFIKLDVNGFEGQVFDGANECIRRFRPSILFELNVNEIIQTGHTLFGIFELFENYGYQLYNDNV
jgi:FkbM family methyltransferase